MLHVYGDANGEIEFYEDDGTSYNYEKGQFSVRTINYSKGCLRLSKSIGAFCSSIKVLKVIFHGSSPEDVFVNGDKISKTKLNNRFVEPVKSIDTFSTQQGDDMREDNLSCFILDYIPDQIILKW